MKIKRGEVYSVNLIETDSKGVEIGKKRPGVVIQSDLWNRSLNSTIILPISSSSFNYISPISSVLKEGEAGLKKESVAIFSQIRAIDLSRLGKKLGELSEERMKEIDRILSLILGLELLE